MLNETNLFGRLLQWLNHSRTRARLSHLNDRYLADIGISRELLEQGVRAWPWRTAADADLLQSSHGRLGESHDARAVAELRSARGKLADAVGNGSTGDDRDRRAA